MLVLLEGNIAAGKTTLGERLTRDSRFTFVREPVERWQSGFAMNLLERFYTDTPRWAFTMQIGAFLTRAQSLDSLPADDGVMVFERSIYCDRHVFAENVFYYCNLVLRVFSQKLKTPYIAKYNSEFNPGFFGTH